MSGRRGVVALLPVIAGAAVVIAFAAWLLRRDSAPSPAVPGPPADADASRGSLPVAEAAAPSPAAAPFPVPAPPAASARRARRAAPERTPWAMLRLVDAETGRPPRLVEHASLVLIGESSASEVHVPHELRPRDDGSHDVISHADDEDEPFEKSLDRVRWRLRVPGYHAVEFASSDAVRNAGRVALRPEPAVAKGVLVAGRGVDTATAWVEVFPAGSPPPAPPRDLPVLPSEFGPFEIHDLTHGRWRLEARARLAEGVLARGVREFEVGERTVDLGEITVLAPTTLLARVVARDGSGVRDPGLRVMQAGEQAQGRPGADGWVEFTGLVPGVPVKIASSLDGLEKEVPLPSEGGDALRVELVWEGEGVRCRLRFLVDGSVPTRWGDIIEGPDLDPGSWRKDGFLEHEMAPGDYLFGIQAEPTGKSGLRVVWAKFTVPRQPTWMADVSFSEETPK